MLDRALARMFSDLSTLILVACVITVPIHLVHAYVFKDELSVRELGPEIRALDEGQRVRGVNSGDIELERESLVIVKLIELAAGVIIYRAAQRVYVVSDGGGVPTVADAFRHLGSGTRRGAPPLGPMAVVGAVAGASAWLALAIGTRLADMAAADLAWVGIGGTRAVAIAVFLAMVAGGAAAMPGNERAPAPAPEKLELY